MDGLEFFFEEAESGFVPREDAGDILGGGIAVVESVVASIHEARGRSSVVISSEPMDGDGSEEQIREVGESEVVGDSNDMAPHDRGVAGMREDGNAEGVVVNNSKGSCWTRRFILRVVAGDLLEGAVATVQSVVASIDEARADCEVLISIYPIFVYCDGEQLGSGQRVEDAMLVEEGTGSYGVASEVVADSNDLGHEDVSYTLIREDGDAEGVV